MQFLPVFMRKTKRKIKFLYIAGLTFRVKISRQTQQKSIVDALVYSQCLYYREYKILPLAQVRQHGQTSGVSSPDVQHFGSLQVMGCMGSLQGGQLRV